MSNETKAPKELGAILEENGVPPLDVGSKYAVVRIDQPGECWVLEATENNRAKLVLCDALLHRVSQEAIDAVSESMGEHLRLVEEQDALLNGWDEEVPRG